MSKWEDKYKEYKSGALTDKINELKELVDNKKANKEQFKEYNKLTKIKKNFPQIKNVMQYRNYLKKEAVELKKEQDARKAFKEASNKKEELGKQLEELKKEEKEIIEKLKNKELSEEEVAELKDKKTKIFEKIGENHKQYRKHANFLRNGLGDKRKYSDLSIEDLNSKKTDVDTKISKCNLVAKNLLNGLSWDAIDYKLENWVDRKLTPKNGNLKENREAIRHKKSNEKVLEEKVPEEKVLEKKVPAEKEEIFTENRRDFDGNAINHAAIKDLEIEETPKEEKGSFLSRHPRLAKIANYFKNIFRGKRSLQELIAGYDTAGRPPLTESRGAEEKTPEKENLEKISENKMNRNENEEFREYIHRIAKEGMAHVIVKDNAEKLEKRTENAVKADRKKYGAPYNAIYTGKEKLSKEGRAGLEKIDEIANELANKKADGYEREE